MATKHPCFVFFKAGIVTHRKTATNIKVLQVFFFFKLQDLVTLPDFFSTSYNDHLLVKGDTTITFNFINNLL